MRLQNLPKPTSQQVEAGAPGKAVILQSAICHFNVCVTQSFTYLAKGLARNLLLVFLLE